MRCRSCDSVDASWVEHWGEYYCEECVNEIYDSLSEFDDLEDVLEEIYIDD